MSCVNPCSLWSVSCGRRVVTSERDGFRWWHAALILVGANVVSAIPAGFGGDFAFYNSFRQPAIAPPDWAFAPVWLFLNVTSLVALAV